MRQPDRVLVDRIEALIQRDVGRNITALFGSAKGGLWQAASALAESDAPRVGLITGFYVPHGTPPAAETDGPAGAALLAAGFSRFGIPCRLLTDLPCRSACAAALFGGGLTDVPVDSVAVGEPLEPVIAAWRAHEIDWVISVERCGRSADGKPRNMRGEDISAHAAPLDDVFTAGPWRSIAIGDGGNEIGMGSLPHGLVAAHVAHGERIACVTPADYLILAGVSHWGVYGLLSALALLHPRGAALLPCLTPALDQAILRSLVFDGPAVDGVSQRQALTIDCIDAPTHAHMLEAVRAVALRG